MMRMAVKTAYKSSFKDQKIGAVLVKGRSIIATGFNQIRPCEFPATNHWECSLHAEIDCIRKVLTSYQPNQLSKYDLYVARVSNRHEGLCAKPCETCQEVLNYYGIRRVYYTNGDTIGILK